MEWLCIRSCLLLWFIGIVLVESGDIAKRDVHRIVLKSRRPRSHHHHHRNHSHNHHHHRSRGKGHGHKRGKHHDHDSRENSYESSKYYGSQENHSFEDFLSQKHKSHHQSKSPSFHSHPQVDKSRIQPFKDEWTPLLSAENTLLSQDSYEPRQKRRPKNENHRYKSHLRIELTTSYPQKLPYPSLFETADYPVVQHSYSNYNQKTIDSNVSPLVQTPVVQHAPYPKFKKINNSYEVHESATNDVKEEKRTTYKILTPTLKSTSVQVAPEESKIETVTMKTEEQKPVKPSRGETKTGRKIRGRGRFNAGGR